MEPQLCQLIEEVCQDTFKSLKRRKAMNRLLSEIQQLPGLAKSSHPDYLDALNKTWEWVNRSICEKFDLNQPLVQKRLVQWLNQYLYWRIKDLYLLKYPTVLSLEATIKKDDTETTFLEQLSETGWNIPTRSGLDSYIEQIQRDQHQVISLELENYIEEDPEGKLRNCYPQAHPNCHCQLISQRILLKSPPDSFAVLARELNIKYQTLKSHWERKCRPLLQEIALELGYQPEP